MSYKEIEVFHLPKGTRDSDRVADKIIKELVDKLDGKAFTHNGTVCSIRRFGDKGVDVVGVEDFDHIEFTITKTGWGRVV